MMVGWDCSFGIATCYGLGGPGIESRWGGGRKVLYPYRPASCMGIGCLFPGVKWPVTWRWPPTSPSAEVKERVELYLYFPLWAFVTCFRATFTFTRIVICCRLKQAFTVVYWNSSIVQCEWNDFLAVLYLQHWSQASYAHLLAIVTNITSHPPHAVGVIFLTRSCRLPKHRSSCNSRPSYTVWSWIAVKGEWLCCNGRLDGYKLVAWQCKDIPLHVSKA